MNARTVRRGQPVLALLVLLGGWCVTRAALWESPFPPSAAAVTFASTQLMAPILRNVPGGPLRKSAPAAPVDPVAHGPGGPAGVAPPENLASSPVGDPSSPRTVVAVNPAPAFPRVPQRTAGGHILLSASALARFEVPPELAMLMLGAHPAPAASPAFPLLVGDTARASTKRWSGDTWLLLRRDTTTPITSGRGSYGQSQAGAVLRYRIAPSDGHRPAAYVRVTAALANAVRPEIAPGVTARPVPGVPLAVAAEIRVAHLDGGTAVRPAAFAYSEFPSLALPFGARAEAYVQGGYVGGRFATAFIDGLLRVDHELTRLGPAELRVGGGAWGGAQRSARRLDIGPGATIAIDLDGAPLRMSADWRFRVAGDANPGSGPALTVSTGF